MQQPQVPQTEKPVPSQLRRIWNAIRRHPFMKLSAVLLAVIFWATVIASDPSLTLEKTFINATVTVEGLEALRSRGYTVMNDLTSTPITVKMHVDVKRSDYDRATVEAFSPKLNVSTQISGVGKAQKVRFAATYANLGTATFEPEYIEVDVEAFTSRSRIPVTVVQKGETAEPLWFSTPTTDITQVTVSGPASLVDQVRRAVVTLPLNSLTPDRPQDTITSLIELQDASNNPISSPLLKIASEISMNVDSARISLNVYPTREVPVSLDSAVVGLPAHGYMLEDVRVSPQSVSIAAPADVLDAIDALHVSSPIDITGQSTSQIVTSALRSVSGVVHSAASDVVVEADLTPATHVHTYVDIPVTVLGVSPDLTAKLNTNKMSVVLSGAYQSVETLKADSLHLFVDATDLAAGVPTLEVTCQVDGSESFDYTLEMPRLMLTLTRSTP